MRIQIQNGRIIDPANNLDQRVSINIADGKIVAVGESGSDFTADHIIDASSQIVCPGFIDLGARLREPGQEYKTTIASEAQAAVSGGITTLCTPPDTDPVTDTPAVVELIRQRGEDTAKIRLLPIGALTQGLAGEQLSEMAELKRAGCIAVSNTLRPVANALIQRRAMEYAHSHNLTVFIHPEEHSLSNGGCIHEGFISTRLGLPGIPAAAETVAVARDLALVEQTGARIHFCRLTTGRAIQMVARAQHDNLPVTADVSAHHLHLIDEDVEGFDALYHVIPPLRTELDRETLRQCLGRGTIRAICSDHQPHEPDAKLAPFPETEPGMTALETLLPLTLKLVQEQVIGLSDAIALLTSGPASILGTEGGTLSVGATADICIFDPEAQWTLDDTTLISHGHNTPYLNQTLQGRVTHTLFEGHVVHTL